jgi:hypothetical protein
LKKGVSTTVYIEGDNGDEIEFEVSAMFYPGRPERWYMSNGDPGYPADPDELDDYEITPEPEDYGIDPDMVIDKAEDGLYENAVLEE